MDTNRSNASTNWASWVNVVLGVWLIIAPWVVGYAFNATALWNSVIMGILVLIASFAAAGSASPTPSWWNAVFGIWLIISPFVLGLGTGTGLVNFIVVGAIVGLLALYDASVKRGVAPGAPVAPRPI